MNRLLPTFALGLLVSVALPASHAQDVTIIPIGSLPIPVTHKFVLGNPIAFIQAPAAGWNLSRVLPGATVRLELGEQFTGATDIKWNLPGNASVSSGSVAFLEIGGFNSVNDGNYTASFTLNNVFGNTQTIELRTTPFDSAPIKNISSRTRLSPDNPHLIAGFVVGREGTVPGMKRLVVVRAVGPSLANFGVTSALADPEVEVFDAEGKVVTPVPRWNATTGQIPVGWQTYEDYLRSVLVTLGAFPTPILDPATDGPPSEPVREYELAPGSYTAVATSADNTSGDVLLEVYEFKGINPAAYFGWPTVIEPTQSDLPGS